MEGDHDYGEAVAEVKPSKPGFLRTGPMYGLGLMYSGRKAILTLDGEIGREHTGLHTVEYLEHDGSIMWRCDHEPHQA